MDKEQLMDKLETNIHDLITKFESATSEHISEISINRDKKTGEVESIDIVASKFYRG